MAGRHVVLDTPTGSGKSLVATLQHFKALCEGQRSFYTAPTKALASEKFFALCDDFGPENVGMLTGDASINAVAPLVCCTAEVLANIALRRGARAQIPYVCMDEFHFYADRERGFAWQAPLLTLPRTTFLLMSATLGDMTAIREDLERRTGRPVAHVRSEVRPVRLDFRWAETPLHVTRGRAAIKDVYRYWYAGFPDFTLTWGPPIIDPPRAAIFWTFEGTSAGPFFGEVRPGTHVKMIGAAEYTFGEAGIIAVRHIFDFSALLVSAGILKIKPAS